MGIIYCKLSQPGEELQKPKQNNALILKKKKSELEEKKDNQDLEICDIPLITKIGEDKLNEFLQEAKQAISCDRLLAPEFKLVETNFKLMKTKYSFNADFTELPSGNKLHEYSHTLEYPFTPAMYFLHSLQQTLETFNKIEDSMNELEVLNFASNDNVAILVSRTKTKKIMVIEPRSFIVVRMIHRISEDEFLEVQKSVQLTSLAEEQSFIKLMASQQNLAEIKLGVFSLVQNHGSSVMRVIQQTDILSSTGPFILKVVLKGKFTKFYQNSIKETLKFILETDPSQFSDFLWFTNDVNEIHRIFQENKNRIKKAEICLSELDKADREIISAKISQIVDEDPNSKSNKSREFFDVHSEESSEKFKNIEIQKKEQQTNQSSETKPQKEVIQSENQDELKETVKYRDDFIPDLSLPTEKKTENVVNLNNKQNLHTKLEEKMEDDPYEDLENKINDFEHSNLVECEYLNLVEIQKENEEAQENGQNGIVKKSEDEIK